MSTSRLDDYHYACLNLGSDHAWDRLHAAIGEHALSGAQYIPSSAPKANIRLYRIPTAEVAKLPAHLDEHGKPEAVLPMDAQTGWTLYPYNPFSESPAFADQDWIPVE